ncbi:energy-coupling factor ABC transporter ATP-binding protein [Desulforamulus putei]|uniref:Energy-coupling factor transport system ATP-binding protein n=1 Tax=Desulforamulus putei DSM 12395 TaxID=1121429 RepID=A0A1M4Y7T3_9FIRM|nr:ATP-binding cassette domain-containing protein [Desulforamulus putei]SHF01778.1 energy-coupling factor transport system ATP-binding protein [Desulforamulus putei DSM 12395]
MQPLIDIKGLSYSYEQGQPALQDINLTIYPGELVALVGQNGAGKTTLVKHCIGLLRPQTGRVTVCGQDAAKTRISHLARQVGFVFQNPDHQIFHDTVQKEVAFGLQNLGLPRDEIEKRVAAALRDVGLQHLAQVYPHRLSRGQRQRVALASVLAMQTRIIILDEPTTGQDSLERLQIMELVRDLNREGHTILFITHDMTLVARYARRVIVLCQGRVIADGSTRDVLSQTQLLAQTLLEPPQITLLANRLNGLLTPGSEVILTVDEMVEHLHKVNGGSIDGPCD